ncbi:hypothetical protein FRC07_003181, partial [Ceratobasidium sp. 392]
MRPHDGNTRRKKLPTVGLWRKRGGTPGNFVHGYAELALVGAEGCTAAGKYPATSFLLKLTGSDQVITDACDFTNFLGLPFVLRLDGTKAYWAKTEHHREGWKNDQRVLHFASAQPGAQSYEFSSVGGIFTK